MRLFLLWIYCCFMLLTAAEGGADFYPPKPGPQSAPSGARPMAALPRPVQAYEVDTLILTASDPAGLAQWAALAAEGFHLVTAIPQDGKQVLFLERLRNPSSADIRLPAAVATDPGLAEATKAKVLQIIGERQQAAAAGRPPAMPQPTKEAK